MMWPSEKEMVGMYWFCGIVCAIAGWCVIEAFLWLWRHFTIAWN